MAKVVFAIVLPLLLAKVRERKKISIQFSRTLASMVPTSYSPCSLLHLLPPNACPTLIVSGMLITADAAAVGRPQRPEFPGRRDLITLRVVSVTRQKSIAAARRRADAVCVIRGALR